MQQYASSTENSAQVTVSIVSHGHGALVSSLLADLATHCGPGIGVILTLNIPESLAIGDGTYPFQVKLIRNEAPKGFGANHNGAFEHCGSPYFCVLNPDIRIEQTPLSPDWVAGMFMLFRKDVYAELAGFDEGYFLYYEDVDLCRRLRKRGYDVRLIPAVSAVHDARRESRRSLRHLRWHLASLLRFMVTR